MSKLTMRAAIAAALGNAYAAQAVAAQETPPPPVQQPEASAPVAVTPALVKIPALTVIELRVVDEISSKTATTGMPIQLVLASPLEIGDGVGLAEGTPVEGVVIHAAKGGMAGKSGELLLGAKQIRLNGQFAIPLRSFKLGPARGKNNEGLAFAAGVAVGLPALFITGGSAKVPAGAIANAKTSSEVEIPVALLSKLPGSSAPESGPAPAQVLPSPTSSIQGVSE